MEQVTKSITNKGGQAPYGFKWYKDELVHEPEEAKIYAQMFDLFLVYQRKQSVAKLLNKKGYRKRDGKDFTYMVVKRYLEKQIAKGVYFSSKTITNIQGEKEHEMKEKAVAPIVSKRIWDHVQAIMTEQAGKKARPPSQNIFISKVHCSCNSIMELPSKSSEYKCPSCEHTIKIDDVWKITEHTFSQLTLPNKKELDNIAQTSLIDLKVNPSLQLKQVNKEIDSLFDFSRSFLAHWEKLSIDMKRIVIENLVDNIAVTPEKATVSLYRLFSFAQQVNTCPTS